MTRTLYKSAMACLAILMVGFNSFGQNAVTDTTDRQAKIDNIIANYYSTIGEQSRLFNGPEYNFYSKIIKGSAYYAEAQDFTLGSIEYDGFAYKNLLLMYDLYKDAVVMQLPSKIASIQLIGERVQSFDLLGHHFLRVEPALLVNAQNLTPGFYDEMYTGKTWFIVKREKFIQNSTSAALDTYFTDEARKMYLHINGSYKIFTNKNSLLNVLGDKKDELKKFIKDNHINFRDEKEQAFVKIVAYYDQITNKI